MPSRKGLNKFQKAAHKPGDRRVTRTQVTELIALSSSADAEERLTAARLLCPCHVRGRVEAAWEAIFRLMEDEDRRVRYAAWHTLEDGGLPASDEDLTKLARLFEAETDAGVLVMAEMVAGKALRDRRDQNDARRVLAANRFDGVGKCDFCAERGPVRRDLDTMIPTAGLPRPALVCARCAPASLAVSGR